MKRLLVSLLAMFPVMLHGQGGPAPLPPATGAFFAVSVADLAASTKWYSEKLGLKTTMSGGPMDKLGGFVVLEADGLIVELIKQNESVRPNVAAAEETQGFTKAGVIVKDFDRVAAALRAHNVDIVIGPYPARETIRANLIIKDNEGNMIQFFGDYPRRVP